MKYILKKCTTKKQIVTFIIVFLWCALLICACIYENTKPKKSDDVITHTYDIEQTIYLFNGDAKKEITSITFGSSDESVLFSIDMKGHHKIKKVIMIEEK